MDNDILSKKIRQRWHEMRSAAKKGRWVFDFDSLDDFGDFLISQNYEPGDILMRIDKTQPFSRYNCFVHKRGMGPDKKGYISKYAGISRNMDEDAARAFDKVFFLGNRYNRMRIAAKAEGIELEWKTLEEFVAWSDSINDKKGKFLVRKDPSKGFTSDNCAWSYGPFYYGGRPRRTEEFKKNQMYEALKRWRHRNREKVNATARKNYLRRINNMTEEELKAYRKKNSERALKYYEKIKAKRLNSN